MKPWTIRWQGHEWTDEDLTAADLCSVQVLLGVEDGWAACDPWRGPVQLSAMIAALYVRATSAGDADVATAALTGVINEIHSSPAEMLLNAISERALAVA